MPAEKDKNRMVYIAYKTKDPKKEADAPASVTFTVEGKTFDVKFKGASPNPMPFKTAQRLISKSRMWTNGAVITMLEAKADDGEAKADEAKAQAEAKAKADAGKK